MTIAAMPSTENVGEAYVWAFFTGEGVGGEKISLAASKGNDALNSWNIGIKPGIAIKLSDHFCLVAKYGFLGYSKKENHGYESENVGIDFDTDELNFGFHYIF